VVLQAVITQKPLIFTHDIFAIALCYGIIKTTRKYY